MEHKGNLFLKEIKDIYEDCNYVDDDSRRQNRQNILKGKPRLCQFRLHFTTYFPNVSCVNIVRDQGRKAVAVRGKRKQGRR